MYSALKRVVLGSPIATSEEHHTRLPKKVALALKARLLFRPDTVVTSVPIHIGEPVAD